MRCQYLLKFNFKKIKQPLASYFLSQETENTETFMNNERKGLYARNSITN